MFDKLLVQAAAAGLVGFNTSVHQFYKYLSSHKTSISKYWVNALQGADFSTIEASQLSEIINIDLVVGERYIIRTEGGDWANVGAANNNKGTSFVATGTTPTSWGDGVLELLSCNQYLDDIYNEEVTNLVTKFINNSRAYLKQRSLLSNHSVIGGIADVEKVIAKSGRFVGFVLKPHEGNNIVNTITKLGFLGNAADSGLKLYLFETSQEDAIATFEFDYTTAFSQQWKAVSDFIIKYDNTRTVTAGQGAEVSSYSNSDTETVSGSVTKVVTFDVPFTDTDYALNVTAYDGSGVAQTPTITSRLATGFSVTCDSDGTVDWVAVKTVTETYSENTYSGGIGQKYLLGYFEDDLTCQAIEMEFNQSLKNFSIFGKFMTAFPFAIPSSNLNGYKLPSDILNIGNYITENTHGLYFKFTANCEYTTLIEDNIDMFAEPLQYALAIRILEDAIASIGDGVHNSTKDAGIAEWRKLVSKYSGILNGGNMVLGDQVKYQKGLIELLTADFSGIDPVCFQHDPNKWQVGNLM